MKEKYIGESGVTSVPKKKITFRLGEKVVKEENIATEAVTIDKLGEDVLLAMKKSEEGGGIALSKELGNSELKGITQKKITEEIHAVNERIDSIDPESFVTVRYKTIYPEVPSRPDVGDYWIYDNTLNVCTKASENDGQGWAPPKWELVTPSTNKLYLHNNTIFRYVNGTFMQVGEQGPQGEKGDTGDTGPQGPQGIQGNTGISVSDNWEAFSTLEALEGKTDEQKQAMIPDGNLVEQTVAYSKKITPTFIEGKTISSNTGAEATSQYFDCTDFIDISMYDKIRVPIPKTTTAYGYALYDEDKEYISGEAAPSSQTQKGVIYKDVTVGTAKYLRYNTATVTSPYFDGIFYPFYADMSVREAVDSMSEIIDDVAVGKSFETFSLTGDGDNSDYRRITFEKGVKYTIVIDPVDYSTTGVTNNMDIYSLSYIKDSASTNLFTTMKGSDGVRKEYTFTAVEADYYIVRIRAAVGTVVNFSITGSCVDAVPAKDSLRLVRSGGTYSALQDLHDALLPSEHTLDDFVCGFPRYNGSGNELKTRLRCAIPAPTIPITVSVENIPSAYVSSLRSDITMADTFNSSAYGVEEPGWITEYTFTNKTAKVLCVSFKIGTAGTGSFTSSDIETLKEYVKVTFIPQSDADNLSDIVVANDPNKTIRYLKSLRKPNIYTSSYKPGVVPFTLLHFSDLHSDKVNLLRIIQYKNTYAPYIDDAIGTGDLIRNTFGQSFDFWSEAGADDILISTGNHEYYNGESSAYYTHITPKQVYDKYIAPYKDNWGDVVFPEDAATEGYNYYYKDYTAKKIRLIVLDNMGNMSATRDNVQATWLASVLESARVAGLHVICALHIGSTIETPFNIPFTGYRNSFNSDTGANVGTFAEFYTLRDAVETFIANGGNFVAWIAGHRHTDSIGILTGYNQCLINIATASGGEFSSDAGGHGSNDNNNNGHSWWIIPKGDDSDRSDNTRQQDCFNIYSVDTEKKFLRIFRVGSDIDRNGRHKGMLLYDYDNKVVLYND